MTFYRLVLTPGFPVSLGEETQGTRGERAPLAPGWTTGPLTKALLAFENPSEGPELPGAGLWGLC